MTGKPAIIVVTAAGVLLVVVVEALALVVDRRAALPAAGVATVLAAVQLRRLLVGDPAAEGGTVDDPRAEALRRWRSATELMIGWADGSRADWDRHLRPKLARDFMLATRQKDAAGLGPSGRLVFGDLWAWVDPHGARPGGHDEAAPGRAALHEILERMDRI